MEDFTSNEAIEEVEIDDSMVDLTGFVSLVKAKEKSPNGNWVQRIVIDNNNGKKVQVVAWGKQIEKFEEVANTNNILQMEGLLAKSVGVNTRYNDGNVSVQLLIQQHTKITKIGIFEPPPSTVVITEVTFNTIASSQGVIRIQGAIKNSFRLLRSKYQRIGIGSITNGMNKLEIHITTFSDNDALLFCKGHVVQVVGEFIKRYQGSPYLNVSIIDDVTLVCPEKSQ